MRPGQNKRMRGRNRKSHNPLTRVYESNGPDVKIRGTASHIAEKYMQLARDAQASGDPVAAENYFQHAEHYFRILNAMNQAAQQAQAQQPGHRRGFQGGEDGGQSLVTDQPMSEAEEIRPAGIGEQPEAREIPIAAAPSEP